MESKPIITEWFNGLPIRVLGSAIEPFFYAGDIAKILGIVKVRSSTKNFDETELVTPEVRKQHNLVTYTKYGDDTRKNNKVTLLTELGAYRLIINNGSDIAKRLKMHVFNTIKLAKLRESLRFIFNVYEPEIIGYDIYNGLSKLYDTSTNDTPIGDLVMQISALTEKIECFNLGSACAELKDRTEYIYFIVEEPFSDKVKIGKTRFPIEKRIAQLQTGNGNKLVLFHNVLRCIDENFERIMHEKYADRRLIGEWFRFSIDELKVATKNL